MSWGFATAGSFETGPVDRGAGVLPGRKWGLPGAPSSHGRTSFLDKLDSDPTELRGHVSLWGRRGEEVVSVQISLSDARGPDLACVLGCRCSDVWLETAHSVF